jgi:hypothetical protein
MTESKGRPGSRSLQDQLERAALSVSNNIAEGFERGTTNELLAFMPCFLKRRKAFGKSKSEIHCRELLERLPPDHPLRKRPR